MAWKFPSCLTSGDLSPRHWEIFSYRREGTLWWLRVLAGLRVRAGLVQCAAHCRHWCQGTSTLRLGGGTSRGQEVHHGSRPRCPGEGDGPGGGPGGEDLGGGLVGARTSCRVVEGGAREAEDDTREVVGPCRAQGSRASEI